jgi:beta-glucosidase
MAAAACAAAVLSAGLVGGAARAGPGAASCPWMNAKLSPQQRAQMLVAAMTIDQKIAMVHGTSDPGTATGGTGAGSVPAIPSLCIPALGLADGAGGLGNGNTGVTAFPAPIGQAAAFDTTQQQAFGRALAQEFVAKAEDDWLAPNVNIARYPLNGRNFEAYGRTRISRGRRPLPGSRESRAST